MWRSTGLGLPILDLEIHSPDWGGLPILDLDEHSHDWGSTLWVYSGDIQVLGYRFWISTSTHLTGGLYSDGLHFGGLESRATDFGSGPALM